MSPQEPEFAVEVALALLFTRHAARRRLGGRLACWLGVLGVILGGTSCMSSKRMRRGLTPSGANIFGKGFFGGA